jgi:hypothetical protein
MRSQERRPQAIERRVRPGASFRANSQSIQSTKADHDVKWYSVKTTRIPITATGPLADMCQAPLTSLPRSSSHLATKLCNNINMYKLRRL